MHLNSLLKELGLTKSKADVYLAALATGPATAQTIALQAGLPRTTTHEVLSNLQALGFVNYSTRGRTRIYRAESPTHLLASQKEKIRRLEGGLPQLMALYTKKENQPKIRIYEGKNGIKTVFEDTLTVQNKLLRGILSMSDLFRLPGREYMEDYTKRRIEAGITLHVIRSEQKETEETWPSSRQEQRELHYAPLNMIFPMTVYIYDNKVGIIGTEQENFGMIIESTDFNRTLQNLFEVIWQVTKVGPKKD